MNPTNPSLHTLYTQFLLQLVLVSISFAVGQSTPVNGGPNNAKDLLRLAGEALAWPDRYVVFLEVDRRLTRGRPPAQDTTGGCVFVRIYADGYGRMHVESDARCVPGVDNALTWRAGHGEHILTSQHHIVFSYMLDNPLASAKVQMARTPQNIDKWRKLLHQDAHLGQFLNGVIEDGSDSGCSVIDLAQQGQVDSSLEYERIHDLECVVVRSQLPNGVVCLWLVPSRNYLPVKYEVDLPSPNSSIYQNVKAVFEATEFLRIDDRWILGGGRLRSEGLVKDTHLPWTDCVQARRVFVNFNPPSQVFASKFEPRGIPEGARVILEDALTSPLKYIWHNGQPVVKVVQEEQPMQPSAHPLPHPSQMPW